MVEYLLATEEQKQLAEMARQILDKELKPRIEEFEHADEGRGVFSMEVFKSLVDAGFYGVGIPEEWGGLGLDMKTQAIIYEEMAKVDAGFTFSFMSASSYWESIMMTKMSTAEKKQWTERILAGEALGAFCLTEASAGSDAGAMQTTAVKNGHEWIINGSKCFVTNGSFADHFCVAAYTDKAAGARKGVTFFFIEKDRGVQVSKKECKLGLKLSETAEVVFDNISVPEDHVIGEVGDGFGESLKHNQLFGRPMSTACCLGLSQAALDYAVEYAKARRQFGKRIIDHQAVGFMIADMKARTEATRAMLYYTIDAIEKGCNVQQLTGALKIISANNTMQNTLDAVQVLGGYGYMKDYPMEKLMRDAKIFQIFGGTGQIHKKNISTAIAGRDPLKKK